MVDKPSSVSQVNESFKCGGHNVLDADKDGLLLDDIFALGLPYNSLIINCAANYLAELGSLPEVTANGNPKDPREMKWQFGGVDQFVLVKKSGAMEYIELKGDSPDRKEWKLNGYGILFGLNPWLVKSDVKKGVGPVPIRTAEYWIDRYKASANQPILTEDDVARFNARDSEKIGKVDYRLDEIKDGMSIRTIIDLIEHAYLLGANEHMVGAGAGAKTFTGDLDDKSETWTLAAWSQVAENYALNIDAHKVQGSESFDLDFSKAKALPDHMVPVGYGIIVNQTDLRAIPSDDACYAADKPSEDDGCEFHRPRIEPVRILWKGKGWYFVKTQQEYGWVREIDLAIAKKEDVIKLLNATAVVNEFIFARGLVRYGMGTRLPLVKADDDSITVEVPVRGTGGVLEWQRIEKTKEEDGLPRHMFDIKPAYTYAGVVKSLLSEISKGVWLLANKPYRDVEGVDCSGATKMALELAGLLLARNSGDQAVAGKKLWERPPELVQGVETGTDSAKLQSTWDANIDKLKESKDQIKPILEAWHEDMLAGRKRGVLILGWKGHVAIFLGIDDAKRAIVASSMSRTAGIVKPDAEKPYDVSQTGDIWTLGVQVTPLDSLETDPVYDKLIPSQSGQLRSWYNRITFINEITIEEKRNP